MSNFESVKKEVSNYITARVPLIILRTSERERAERMLRQLSVEKNADIIYYTEVRQAVNLRSMAGRDLKNDPLAFARDQFRKQRGTTFAIGDVCRVGEENNFTRELLNVLYLAADNAGTFILVTQDYVWNRLALLGMMTELDYPDEEERENLIRKFISDYSPRFPIEWEDEDIRMAAMVLRGFTEIQMGNILSSLLVSEKALRKSDIVLLGRQKSRLYAAVPCVDEVKTESTPLMPAGLYNLRAWLKERKQLFYISDDILRQHGLSTPKGILLVGIPGCGKSFSARIVAHEWGLPLFRFDIGGVYDKWVGESERKMSDALKFMDSVAPCVVWIDEIEKALAVSDSGNDTGKRVLGQFLFWLQESTGRVFLVATANDISKLPSELFRKGRFSETFFLDLPNCNERSEAITLYMNRCLGIVPEEMDLSELTKLSEGCSYADIEAVIKEAAQWQLRKGSISADKVKGMFRRNIPFAETNSELVERLREWSRNRAIAASAADRCILDSSTEETQ